MDPLTHVAAGLVLSQVMPLPSRAVGAVAGICFALLPDIDYFFIFSDRLAYLKYHRGITHSLAAALAGAMVVGAVARLVGGPRWGKGMFLLGVAVLGSHLLLDVATSYGTQLLSPFSRQKLALDWLFIIDPYLTGLLVIGAGAAMGSVTWGRQVGVVCLALAGVYFLICGYYHHQAMVVAARIFGRAGEGEVRLAAIPQPLSCRRWQLLAGVGEEVRQAMVELPWLPVSPAEVEVTEGESALVHGSAPVARKTPYRPPSQPVVHRWRSGRHLPPDLPWEGRQVLTTYLDFARFPIMLQGPGPEGGKRFYWLDLRFNVPGLPYPFVLAVDQDTGGEWRGWQLLPAGRDRWGRK